MKNNSYNSKRSFFKISILSFFTTLLWKKITFSDYKITKFEKETGFRNYGFPSKFEKIFRWIVSNPVLKGNGVSYTPISKLKGTIVPNGLHFERHHYGIEDLNPKKYKLIIEIDSLNISWNLNQLRNKQIFSTKTFIECGGNSNVMYNNVPIQSNTDLIHGLLSYSEWSGVRLKDLFSDKKISKLIKNYQWLEFVSYDKGAYNISLPLKDILKSGFIALYQNGEAIRPEQGYPARLIIPGWEGSTHVKWLKKIVFRNSPVFSRNETSRYTDLLPSGKAVQFSFKMKSKSIILSPSAGQKINPGKVFITGLAWSGTSYIKKVQVSFDRGKKWFDVKLDENKKRKSFLRFNYTYNWAGNEIIICSRCIDGKNKTQPSRESFLKKMGHNAYYHYNGLTYWKISSDGKVSHTY